MKKVEQILKNALRYNYSWIYKYNSIKDLESIQGVRKIASIETNLELYSMYDNFFEENLTMERIKNEIDKRNLVDAAKMLDIMTNSFQREYCQILLLKNLKMFLVMCDDITKWKDSIIYSNIRSINTLDKLIVKNILDTNFSENVLSATIFCDDCDEMLDADTITIQGSKVQNSKRFTELINDPNSKILKYTIQPKNENFLATFKGINTLEVSEYITDNQYYNFIINFLHFYKKIEKTII